jgi:hypothetical protein
VQKLHRKYQHNEPFQSLRFYGTRHLHAHDCVERRFGSTTEYGPHPSFQADEGLHCGRERAGCFCGASSKDAENKITTIMQLEDIAGYRALFERLLREGE